MRYVLGIVVVLLAVGGAWYFLHPANRAVEVVHPVTGEAIEAVYATGTVEATIMMPIAARTTARLIELNADEGLEVKKGQVMARLEDTDLQSSIEGLKAQEIFARKDYERKAALLKKGYETKASVDLAASNWDSAKAAVARAMSEADFMKLLAPDDGLVIQRDGEIGQMIPANQPVFWISCCAPLRISAEVDEEDISRVKIGQPVLIRADAFPGQIFQGTVQSITPKGDAIARSYRVRIRFNEETPLQIGMTAESNIILSQKADAMLIPSTAVTSRDKVWIVKDGKLAQTAVTTGAKGLEKTEIRSGLSMTDLVVADPSPDLVIGDKVGANLIEQEQKKRGRK